MWNGMQVGEDKYFVSFNLKNKVEDTVWYW